MPATTYIGGLYEKTDTGSVTKYYGGVAMRQVPAGGGSGTLLYLLKDHLGSAVGVMDAFGARVRGNEGRSGRDGGASISFVEC